jgi:hypothetical protein
VDRVAGQDLKGMFGPQALDRTRSLLRLKNRIDAELARTVREGELTQAAHHDGAKTMQSWLRGDARAVTRRLTPPVSGGGLWRDAERGRSLPGMPEDGRHLVLVDVRPTACGYQALLWALCEAERRDAVLLAVTVWLGDPAQPDEGRAEMEAALAAMVERAVDETGVHGRTRVAAVTHPVTAADVAVSTGAELLVLGSEQETVG